MVAQLRNCATMAELRQPLVIDDLFADPYGGLGPNDPEFPDLGASGRIKAEKLYISLVNESRRQLAEKKRLAEKKLATERLLQERENRVLGWIEYADRIDIDNDDE